MTQGTRSRARASVARLLFFAGAVTGCGSAPAAEPPTPASPAATAASPVTGPAYYTADQAERGRRVFGSVCSVCHGRNEFAGPIFELTWVAEPIGHLFQHVSTSMPQDDPGSLSTPEYVAVVAYLLQLNGRPAGDRELPADVRILNSLAW